MQCFRFLHLVNAPPQKAKTIVCSLCSQTGKRCEVNWYCLAQNTSHLKDLGETVASISLNTVNPKVGKRLPTLHKNESCAGCLTYTNQTNINRNVVNNT